MEYLVAIEVNLPASVTSQERDDLIARERVRGKELCDAGVIRAMWRVPGRFANRGIWSAPSATALHAAISSLPLWDYIDANVTPLADHDLAVHCLGLPPGLGSGRSDESGA